MTLFSGTISFSRCTGRCLFCQNYPISQLGVGNVVSVERLAEMMLELQAKGCHNVNMVGPLGAGKTLLVRSIPSILPHLIIDEALDITRIYSVTDMLPPETPLIMQRPFRAPHHTISHAGLVGGGRWPRPGEISLAHQGVLFLEEVFVGIACSERRPAVDLRRGPTVFPLGTIEYGSRFLKGSPRN